LAEVFGQKCEEVMLPRHVPVFNHFTELVNAAVHQFFLNIVRVAYDLPEEVTNLDFELVILGKLSKLTKALELFNSQLF
jgi:hypothetical protein